MSIPTGHKVRRWLFRGGLTIFVVFNLAGLGCTIYQRKLIYVPRHDSATNLDALAKVEGIERWKNSAGENIGWHKPALHQPARGQLLMTHGNGDCAIDRFGLAQPLSDAGDLDIFILEYPGYGDRTGSPCQDEFFKAADEAFLALPTNGPAFLLGESLGTGVASYLAGTRRESVAGVLLIAPYTSLVDVAQYHVKIFPMTWIIWDRYPSEEYLRDYHGPVGMLVGNSDQVVPAKFGRRLFEGYQGPKRLWEVPNGTHASISREPAEFWDGVVAFWREAAK